MIEYHARDANDPGFDELLDELMAASWKAPARQDTTAPFNAPSTRLCSAI